jgi:hypothetical protein
MRPSELPEETIVRWIVGVLIVAFFAFLLMYAWGCSLFRSATTASTTVKCVNYQPTYLPGEYPLYTLVAVDLTTGLPLLSTAHRAQLYCSKLGAADVMPESPTANIFSSLQNLPATAGGMLQSTGGAALGAH